MKNNPVHPVDPVKKKNPAAVALGRLGGLVTGPSKSRGTIKARRAARIRWAKYRAAQKTNPATPKRTPRNK